MNISPSQKEVPAQELELVSTSAVKFRLPKTKVETEKLLLAADEAYHEKSKPVMTDRQYDELKEHLKANWPSSKVLRRVGAAVTSGRKKVRLPHPMYSLDKFKPETSDRLDDWVSNNPADYVVISSKLDGASLQVVYDSSGRLKSFFTRGDGTVGQDVTDGLLPYATKLGVPLKFKPNAAVRGEIAMSGAAFSKHAATEYANARNLVAGLVNKLKGDKSLLTRAGFLAHELISPRAKPSAAFKTLAGAGFQVVQNLKLKNSACTAERLTPLLAKLKGKSKIEMDGLVLEYDYPNKRPKAGTHSPSYAVAYKVTTAEDVVRVKVQEVVWQASRLGLWKPVIVVPPTKLAGVTVTRATGHNAFFIEHGYRLKDRAKGKTDKYPVGKGAVVALTRSGDVIPHVVKVLEPSKATSTPPKGEFKWNADRTEYLVVGDNADVTLNAVTNFFTTLKVPGIKSGTVKALIEAGYDTPIKISRMTVEDYLELDGFQERKATTLVSNIATALADVDLASLMDASGLFGFGFGTRKLALVVKKYPDLERLASKGPAGIATAVAAIPGFAENSAKNFAAKLPKFMAWWQKSKIRASAPKKVKAESAKLKGQNITFTGFRDSALEDFIVRNGGVIGSGVSSKTTLLLAANPASGSSKISKAKQLGIKVFTPGQFRTKYDV